MQQLIIIQGPPGSGKSTMARSVAWELFQNSDIIPVICSPTDYVGFTQDNLEEFRIRNRRRVIASLYEGYPYQPGRTVIVDDTHLNAWEAKPYVAEAVNLKITIRFIRCNGNYQSETEMDELTIKTVMESNEPINPLLRR